MKNIAGKIFFVVGIIIILIILAYLILTFIPKVFSSLANVGGSINTTSNALQMSFDTSNISSGDVFTASWDLQEEAGTYAVTYSCIDDLVLAIVMDNGSSKRLICGTPYNLGEDIVSASFIPTLDRDDTFIDAPLTITYTPENGGRSINGNQTFTIKSSTSANIGTLSNNSTEVTNVEITEETPEEPEVEEPVTPTRSTPLPPAPLPLKPADLAISNVQSTVQQNGTIVFTVSNIGEKPSGNWFFNYSSPTANGSVRTSPLQPSLNPGDRLQLTIRFTSNNPTRNVVIVIDSSNQVSEISESNNVATVQFGTTPTTPILSGSDITISNLQSGRLIGGQFFASNDINGNEKAAVSFVVKNTGSDRTTPWNVSVDVSSGTETLDFGAQAALNPGESRTLTIEVVGLEEDENHQITITVDSNNTVFENNENNNRAQTTLNVR